MKTPLCALSLILLMVVLAGTPTSGIRELPLRDRAVIGLLTVGVVALIANAWPASGGKES